MPDLLTRLSKSIRRRGVSGTLWLMGTFANEVVKYTFEATDEFDRTYKVRTGKSPFSNLERIPGSCGYNPIPPEKFTRAMQALKLDFSRFTFIDFGSGKGRALLLASQHGFH